MLVRRSPSAGLNHVIVALPDESNCALPAWMLDESSCAMLVDADDPRVDLAALQRLLNLLDALEL